MSMQFDSPVNDEAFAKIKEAFGEPKAHDRKTFLFDSMPTLQSKLMGDIARAAKQPATVEVHGEGEIKTVGDDRYQVTPEGWRKLGDE